MLLPRAQIFFVPPLLARQMIENFLSAELTVLQSCLSTVLFLRGNGRKRKRKRKRESSRFQESSAKVSLLLFDRIKFERVVRKRGGIAMVLLLFVEENAERMERKWGSVEFERGVRRRVTSFWVKKWRNFESPVPDRFLAVKLMNFFYIFFSILSARKEKVADVAVDHLSIYTRLSRPPPSLHLRFASSASLYARRILA